MPDTISDDLRCPPINRRRPPNNLRLVARFCVGLAIQVEIQCLRVFSGALRLNRRRPSTIRTLSVIVADESYGGIVVNCRVYKGASDRIDNSLKFGEKKDARRYRLRCNRRRSEANPTICRLNRVKIPDKISDNVTAPLLLGLLLRFFEDFFYFLRQPPAKTYPRQIADIVTGPLMLTKIHSLYQHVLALI